MLNANLKLVGAVTLAVGMASGCAPLSTTEDTSVYGYSPEAARAFREMKQRQQADPQVSGWQFVNPQDVRFTADP